MDLPLAVVLAVVTLPYLLAGWLFVRAYRRRKGPLRRSALVLLVLVALDGVVVGQGLLTIVIAALAVVTQIGLSLWRALKREKARSLAHLGAAGVYVVTVCLVWGYIAFNARLAQRRAGQLIAACRDHEAKHGRLPQTLADLVPGSLPSVPRARYTLLFGGFQYSVSAADGPAGHGAVPAGSTHVLQYVVLPPLLRRRYVFELDAWTTLD
jgi:hypothetical protein